MTALQSLKPHCDVLANAIYLQLLGWHDHTQIVGPDMVMDEQQVFVRLPDCSCIQSHTVV